MAIASKFAKPGPGNRRGLLFNPLLCRNVGRVTGRVRSASGHVAELMQRVKEIQGDATVLLVTTDRPYLTLKESGAAEGVDLDALWFLDTVSAMTGQTPNERPRRVLFIQSPTMLEMIAMRIEQMQRTIPGPVHVIIDSLSSACTYNKFAAVQEFTHYLVNRLRTLDLSADLVVTDDEQGTALQDSMRPMVDAVERLVDA